MALLTINPFYLLAIAAICELFVVLLFIWRSHGAIHRSLIYKHPGFLSFGITFCFLTYYALFISLVGYLQGWLNLTSQFILPFILCAIIATDFLWGGVFILPTKRTIVVHLMNFFSCFLLVAILFPLYSNYYFVFGLAVPLVIVPLIAGFLRIIPTFRNDHLLYDKSDRFFRINNLSIHLILFCVVVIELFLQYRGYSMIIW